MDIRSKVYGSGRNCGCAIRAISFGGRTVSCYARLNMAETGSRNWFENSSATGRQSGRLKNMQQNNYDILLTPAQTQARALLERGLQVGNVCAISGDPGSGKTTVLAQLHPEIGGRFPTAPDLIH